MGTTLFSVLLVFGSMSVSLDGHKQRRARLFGFCFGVYRQENRPRLHAETLLIFRRAKARNAAHAVPDFVSVLLAARLPRALPGLLAVAKVCKVNDG